MHNKKMLAEIEDSAKVVIQNVLQPGTTRDLPDSSDKPTDESSESSEASES